MPSAAARAAAGFVTRFGRPPAGVWSAPGRVNLIGEHTDYNSGLALPIALPWCTYAAMTPRPDRVLRAASEQMPGAPVRVELDQVRPAHPGGWAAYVAGVFWALREAGYPTGGADIHVSSDVPIGAGLSSSAALECAVAAALSDTFGLSLLADDHGRATLARVCQEAENVIAGAPTGGLDQSAALHCREHHALLLDFRNESARHVPFDLAAHGLTLLVVDTRAAHALTDGQYAQRRRTCEHAAHALGVPTLREVRLDVLGQALTALTDEGTRAAVRHVVTEIDRVTRCVAALRADDFAEVGRLMTASHVSLRDDYVVSCPELDTAVAAALAAGALGARMTGGGFGGSAIALVEAGRGHAVADAVRAAFAAAGFQPPDVHLAEAASGARRVA